MSVKRRVCIIRNVFERLRQQKPRCGLELWFIHLCMLTDVILEFVQCQDLMSMLCRSTQEVMLSQLKSYRFLHMVYQNDHWPSVSQDIVSWNTDCFLSLKDTFISHFFSLSPWQSNDYCMLSSRGSDILLGISNSTWYSNSIIVLIFICLLYVSRE